MNPSRIAKIVIILCIISLFIGFLGIDRDSIYGVTEKKNNNSKNVISTVNKIAVIELQGVIDSSSEEKILFAESNAANMLKTLKTVASDNNIRGVIVKINSPGGTVAMSQNIYNEIIKLRKTKPVVAVFDDVAASGGYYIASAADRIIAQSGTLTGSIGVIMSFMDYHNLLIDKLNINSVVIKSGKYKDIGSGMRAMKDEEKQLMQNIVNDSYEQFLEAITSGRISRTDKYSAEIKKLTVDVLKANADGRVFTGRQAYKLGFVDALGGVDTAMSMIEKMAQEKYGNSLSAKFINYNKKSSFAEYFSTISDYGARNTIKITDIVPQSIRLNRKPLYLWE